MMRTTKIPEHGIRVQMVLKLTNKVQMAEIEIKQTFHHRFDNFISYIGCGCPMHFNEVIYGKLKTPFKVNSNLKHLLLCSL